MVEVWTNCIWMVTAKWKFLNQTVKKCTQSKHLARFIYIDCVEKAIEKAIEKAFIAIVIIRGSIYFSCKATR